MITYERPQYEMEQREAQMRPILIFLDWLKAQANSRYAEIPNRWANYEDLAYLAGQIGDDIGHEYENPGLHPFVQNALMDLGGLFGTATPAEARKKLRDLATSTVDYIRSAVGMLLKKTPADTDYLQFFAKACRDESVTKVNLFTLNHDTLIERFLPGDGIKVVDGLRDATNGNGSRRWDPAIYDEGEKDPRSVNLFKLHGSVDWFRWDPIRLSVPRQLSSENTDRDGRFVGTYQDTQSPLYDVLESSVGPRILAGTFNKILAYNSEIFLELHHRFHRALQDPECKNLVVCGYGFGDKGVNTRISEWRHRSYENRLLIIDPADATTICQKARGAIFWDIEASLCPKEVSSDTVPDSEDDPDPLDALINRKSRRGPVKHLPKGIGKRPEDKDIEVVTWEEVRKRLVGNDDEFLV